MSDLHRILRLKRQRPFFQQDLERYQQVLHFMNWQLKQPCLTRKEAAVNTAIGFGKGKHVARQIPLRERDWICNRTILHSNRGRHAKAVCMLEDEGTLRAVREYLEEAGESKSHWHILYRQRQV